MEKLRAGKRGSLDSQTRRITTPKFPALIRLERLLELGEREEEEEVEGEFIRQSDDAL